MGYRVHLLFKTGILFPEANIMNAAQVTPVRAQGFVGWGFCELLWILEQIENFLDYNLH